MKCINGTNNLLVTVPTCSCNFLNYLFVLRKKWNVCRLSHWHRRILIPKNVLGRSIFSLLNVFCNLSRCKNNRFTLQPLFVNIPNGIVVFDVGNAINVEQSMCACFKESFEKNFWLQPSTITVVACCRIATIARTICFHYQPFFFSKKNPMKLWFLMSDSQPIVKYSVRSLQPILQKQCFLDVRKLHCSRVWVSFKEKKKAWVEIITNVCDELIWRISCEPLHFGSWAPPNEEQTLNLTTLSLQPRKLDTSTLW